MGRVEKMTNYRFPPVSPWAVLLFGILFLLSSCTGSEQRQELNILCLGDSITHGFKLPDPAQESFPSRMEEHSQGLWHVQNLGVNGATVLSKGDIPIINQDAYRIAMHSSPDVVVLMLGTNDTKNNNWRYISDFLEDYRRIVDSLQHLASRPRVIVCTIPPIFLSPNSVLDVEHVTQVNRMIRSVAAESGAEFLNVHQMLAGKSNLFIDGIHPNALGAVELAGIIYSKILQVIE